MKRLILMRHAKSSWADPGQPDHDRPLNDRGIDAAARVGKWLRARGYRPDQALVSTVARAQQTWAGVAEALDHPPMEPRPEIYRHAGKNTRAAPRRKGRVRTDVGQAALLADARFILPPQLDCSVSRLLGDGRGN